MALELVIRTPSSHTYSTSKTTTESTLKSPPFEWISTTWNVSYSSLPLWKGKQNVRITYSLCGPAPQDPSKMPTLDDHVESQKLGQTKTSHIHGISRPVEVKGLAFGLAYSWRGKGLLKIASSDWEILGYGSDNHAAEPNDWVVTFFSKTLFTPAGIDIYTRTKANLSDETLDAIKSALATLSDEKFTTIVNSIFEIPRTE
jgi:hypothetical protein